MKHIVKRDDFLKRNKYSVITNILNEAAGPFANDIPWGDSLVGRLINSSIRKAKIGYNLTKIPNLLEQFKSQLDILISSSLSKDVTDEFNLLQIKAWFHQIGQVCTNTITDEDKLDQLIGGHQDLWDQSNQNAGAWKNILTQGLVIDCYRNIEAINEDQLKNLIDKNNLLDQVSIFIDNLRRLTDVNGPAPMQTHGFIQLFGALVNRFSVINESIYSSFEDLILEEINIDNLKSTIKKREDDLSKMSKDDPGRSALENELANAKRALDKMLGNSNSSNNTKTSSNNKSAQVAKTGGLVKTDSEKETDKKETGLVPTDKKETGLVPTDKKEKETGLVTQSVNNKIKELKRLANLCKPKKLDTLDKIKKDNDAISFIKLVATIDNNDLTYLRKQNPKEEFNDIQEFNSQKEAKDISFSKKNQEPINKNKDSEKTQQSKNKESKSKEFVESYRYDSYDRIFEASATASTVVDVWNKFLSESKIPSEMYTISQRELDRLNDMNSSIVNGELVINLADNPDPIIGICRIFKRANDLYFTPVIPSGRTNGKVSNITFREYEKLGGQPSSASDANNPGYGPWANKKIRNEWTDGVLAILQDQQYRKILSNLRFIVPGSEDKFNKVPESFIKRYDAFMKVFEADEESKVVGGKLGKDKKSHGQILFDFINDLLDNKTAADFDGQRRILLKRYFEPYGLKPIKDDLPSTPVVARQIDCDENSIFWRTVVNKVFAGATTKPEYKGKYYALPIQKTKQGNHEMIFLHLLRKVTVGELQTSGFQSQTATRFECYYVKFVFDNQEMINKYKQGKRPKYDVKQDWSTSNYDKKVFYGIITKIGGDGKFTLVYSNVSGGNSPTVINGSIRDNYTLEEGQKNGTQGTFAASFSELVEAQTQNTPLDIITDYNGILNGEKPTHGENLNIPVDIPASGSEPEYKGALREVLLKKLAYLYK